MCAQGVSRVPLTIPVVDAARYDRNDHFFVVLWGLTHRATFLSGRDSLLATIEVTSDQERRRSADEVATELRRDVEVIKLGWSSWEEQLKGALVFQGSNCAARVVFAASLPWKLLFAFIPPPAMMHGWPCFLSALFVTGAQPLPLPASPSPDPGRRALAVQQRIGFKIRGSTMGGHPPSLM